MPLQKIDECQIEKYASTTSEGLLEVFETINNRIIHGVNTPSETARYAVYDY